MKISMSRREIVFTACLVGIAAWTPPTLAAPFSFKVPLTGAQQVQPVQTAGRWNGRSYLRSGNAGCDVERQL